MKQYKYPFSIITIFYNEMGIFTLFLIRKMTYLQMNTPLISNLLTGLNILLREYIHDGKLCMLDHAVAFLSKIQHSLISIVKDGLVTLLYSSAFAAFKLMETESIYSASSGTISLP